MPAISLLSKTYTYTNGNPNDADEVELDLSNAYANFGTIQTDYNQLVTGAYTIAGAKTFSSPVTFSNPIILSANSNTVAGSLGYSSNVLSYYNGTKRVELTEAINAASQAEQEAGTEAGKFVAPATQHYHPSAVKAWASINGKGTAAILASYNCSSMVDNGTGDYTVNFTTAMSSTTYAAVAGGVNNDGTAANTSNNRAAINTFNKQTGSVDISCLLISASSIAMGDADYLDLAILGDL